MERVLMHVVQWNRAKILEIPNLFFHSSVQSLLLEYNNFAFSQVFHWLQEPLQVSKESSKPKYTSVIYIRVKYLLTQFYAKAFLNKQLWQHVIFLFGFFKCK